MVPQGPSPFERACARLISPELAQPLVLILCLSADSVFAISVDSPFSKIPIDSGVEYIEDPGGLLTFDYVAAFGEGLEWSLLKQSKHIPTRPKSRFR